MIETSKNIPFSETAPAIEGLFVRESERMPGEQRFDAYSAVLEGMRKTFAQAYLEELSVGEIEKLENLIESLGDARSEATAALAQQGERV